MRHNILRRGAALLLALLLMVPATALPAQAADPNVTLDWTGDVENNTLDVVVGETAALDLTVRVAGEDPNDPYKLGMSPNSHTWTDAGEIEWRVYFTEDTTLHPADGTFRFIRLEIKAKQVGSQDITIKFHPFGNTSTNLLEKTLTVNVTPKVTLDHSELSTYRLNGKAQPVDVSVTNVAPLPSGGTLSYAWENLYPNSFAIAHSNNGQSATLTPRESGRLKAVAKATWTPGAGSDEQPITGSAICTVCVFDVGMNTDVSIKKGGSENIAVSVSCSGVSTADYQGRWSVVSDGGTGVSVTSGSGFNGTLNVGAGGKAGDAVVRFELLKRSGNAVQFAIDCDVHVTEDDTPATVKVTGVTLSPKTLSIEVGKTVAPTATVTPANADDRKVTWSSSDTSVATVGISGLITGISAGTAVITATTNDGGFKDTCTVTVTKAADPVAVTGVTLDKSELTVEAGKSADPLKATVAPDNADDKTVTWKSSDETIATVSNGVVTGVKPGTANITVTTADGGKQAVCKVTVTRAVSGVTIGINAVQFNQLDSRTREIVAGVTPSDATFDRVEWSSGDTHVVTVSGQGTTGVRAVLTAIGPGQTTVRATAGDKFAECTVIVSGITLNRTSLPLAEGKSETLQVTGNFGEVSGSATWTSSDPSVAAVGATNGRVTARSAGTATITASKGAYTATCRVTVSEDTTGLVSAGSIAANGELDFSTLRAALNRISTNGTGTGLSYITNLSVPPEQGVLHYRYISEPDTGAGVGVIERYYYTAAAGRMALDNLSFVPNKDYSGIAEISYTGYGTNGQSVSGIIRVTVNSMRDISYSTSAGMPVTFQLSDFGTVCLNRTGRELDYVTFTLPQSDLGKLYYNYTGQSQYAELVTSSTRYRRTGSPYVNNVTFVPAADYSGTFSITYQGVDTAGVSYTGRVTITVSDRHIADVGNIYYTAEKGERVIFQEGDFADVCKEVTGETLNYVRFTLPPSSQGALYYNYRSSGNTGSAVSSSSGYYYKNYPALANVSFVPANSASTQAVIDYTGYGVGGSAFSGSVYIELKEASPVTVRYSVYSGKTVAFQAADFNNASIAATGAPLNYVRFTLPTSTQGSLRYNYRSTTSTGITVSASTNYYRTGGTRQIDSVSFLAGLSYTGTVRFNYTGYSRDNDIFVGTVVIQVNAPEPSDVNYNGTGASPVSFTVASVRTACNAVLSQELSYIQFTSLPSNSEGRLYIGYDGYDTGTPVAVNTRYYCSGNPNISQISFVPRGGFEGVAVIPYTGVGAKGQQVSGLIKITINNSGGSRYFTDMGDYRWAGVSADYLYLNDVVMGMSAGKYGPGLNIRRCDFVVMLCRAFGFSSNTNVSFPDVPTDAYYAKAVAAAKSLGIVLGDGVNFMPNSQVTRQDAMVMICRALNAVGWKTNGTATNLSPFADGEAISGYARTSVSTLVQYGAVSGDSNGRLRPLDPLTRAEMAAILHSVMTM